MLVHGHIQKIHGALSLRKIHGALSLRHAHHRIRRSADLPRSREAKRPSAPGLRRFVRGRRPERLGRFHLAAEETIGVCEPNDDRLKQNRALRAFWAGVQAERREGPTTSPTTPWRSGHAVRPSRLAVTTPARSQTSKPSSRRPPEIAATCLSWSCPVCVMVLPAVRHFHEIKACSDRN
jgi:hypothetical protein